MSCLLAGACIKKLWTGIDLEGFIMLLDRELQLELLTEMSEVYPSQIDVSERHEYGSNEYYKLIANLAYLQDHKLISDKSLLVSKSMDGNSFQPYLAAITHTGMDFLADDGGLSAILGTVTVKFETEQFKVLLESIILSSDLPTERKQTMIDALRELPAESMRHLITKVVDSGWDNLGSLMIVIQSILLSQ